MELKRVRLDIPRLNGTLLIVPYGIETFSILGQYILASELLIVPYGIETLDSK